LDYGFSWIMKLRVWKLKLCDDRMLLLLSRKRKGGERVFVWQHACLVHKDQSWCFVVGIVGEKRGFERKRWNLIYWYVELKMKWSGWSDSLKSLSNIAKTLIPRIITILPFLLLLSQLILFINPLFLINRNISN
jgi:hypothetical protein